MSGKCILIVGARGMGKSTTLRNELKKANKKSLIIYDVNGEHKDLYPYPLIPFEEFTDMCSRVYNAVIVIEEATIYLSNRGNNFDVKEFLVKARHRNNTVFMNYHSLRSLPIYIYDLSDFIVLHKTKDKQSLVEKKFEDEEFTEEFLKIKNAALLDSGKVKANGEPILYSPHVVLSIN